MELEDAFTISISLCESFHKSAFKFAKLCLYCYLVAELVGLCTKDQGVRVSCEICAREHFEIPGNSMSLIHISEPSSFDNVHAKSLLGGSY
jgi:hypothetical protein